jgi:hypothetical protein
MRLMTKYLKAPRLRTRESFVRYIEKWVLLSSVLGLLTGFTLTLVFGFCFLFGKYALSGGHSPRLVENNAMRALSP